MTLAAMRRAATAWFSVAVAGQLIFAAYVLLLYARTPQNMNKVMPHGHVPGDLIGNSAVVLHLAWAFVILTSGAIQLVPQFRRRWPALHRWSGRVYMTAAILTSLSGLFMVATRGTVGGAAQHISICLNGILILLCATMAWRQARARQFASHRRWALRLFLVASGVWFFRIGLMLWLVIFRAPVGFDPKTFTGPFLTFLAFAQFLLPLAVLELYWRAEQSPHALIRLATTSALAIFTLATAAGIAAATMGLWLPRL